MVPPELKASGVAAVCWAVAWLAGGGPKKEEQRHEVKRPPTGPHVSANR